MAKKLHLGRAFHYGKEVMNRFYNQSVHEVILHAGDARRPHQGSTVAYMHHLIDNIQYSSHMPH
ncbi:hypothetical protein [Pseudochrobactrum sp. HB0163]|uniref:hypothetical protein n=1 Tax=Pseudochrobactrum sp. HB0163 TaxID=3450708 RepID=UPI003F6E17BE